MRNDRVVVIRGMRVADIKTIYDGRTPGIIGKHRFFSVIVPFIETPEGVSLLYEVRSHEVSQPDEICFPGGHMEKGESPRECAIRETKEELGISESNIDVFAQGDTMFGNGNFTLYTFLAEIKTTGNEGNGRDAVSDHDPKSRSRSGNSETKAWPDISNLKLQKEEVAEVFTVHVEKFLEIKPEVFDESMMVTVDDSFPYEKLGIDRDYPWHVPKTEIPIYDIDGRVIWGITARITGSVLDVIRHKKCAR